MRALSACGDGFWEFDLLDGSAWFSEWFYRKLNWSTEIKRTGLSDLQPLLPPAAWEELIAKFRSHFEQGQPLDLKLRVQVAGGQHEWWHLRGCAQRNDAGQPIYLAGSVRDVSADVGQPEIPASLLCLRGAFEAFPVAAALLDARGAVLNANRKWFEFREADAVRVIARLQELNPQAALEFSLDDAAGSGGGVSPHVRAVPFEHNGIRHLVATLENR